MINRIIKTAEEYEKARILIDELIDRDPLPGTPEADQLELLSLLVEEYENKLVSIGLPSPVEAIRFRMEQQNLKQKDLVQYLGGKSKVSEILSGKRPLSLNMIRALSEGLGIPVNVLIQESEGEKLFEWSSFPIREMNKRGWINVLAEDSREAVLAELKRFFAPIGLANLQQVHYRMTKTVRSNERMDEYSLLAWTAHVYSKAKSKDGEFSLDEISPKFMKDLAKLSARPDGPLAAMDKLAERGVAVVIEKQLPKTYIDGAAILLDKPVIGLTLRYDRVDNFWFALIHELSHVYLHYGKGIEGFFDDLQFNLTGELFEWEADNLTAEVLIPEEEWLSSAAHLLPTESAARLLADQLGIHVAIVAGRIRRERKNYSILNDLVGHGAIGELLEYETRN